MSCTAEEIAEKRRIAIERLNARRKVGNTSSDAVSASLKPPTTSAPLASKNFYGSSTKNPEPSGTSLAGKIKPTFNHSRQNAEPYRKRPAAGTGTTVSIAPVFIRSVTCSCSMVSESRFLVEPSSFNPQMIEVFKEIPSRNYDGATKRWTFDLKEYKLVQEKIAKLNPHVVIGPIPGFAIRLFSEGPKSKPTRACLNALEPKLQDALLSFQKEGVCFAIDKGGRALIADEMGLGKTYQAIAVADFYREDWPLLVCTTASTRDVWATKVRQLLPYVPVHNIMQLSNGQDYIGDARVLISSYSLMERCCDKLLGHGFGTVIFDESHTLKNFKAKCTTVAMELSKKARRVILLSGTPALSRPVELFTQLQLLDRSFCSFKEYSTRYCAGKQSNFGWDSSGQSNLTELNLILAAKFMIRRTKEDVMSELTEKSRETIILDSSLVGKDEEFLEDLNTYAADYTQSKGKAREEILIKYYSASAEAKAPAICYYLKGVLKEKKKFIVFAHHHAMLDAICHSFNKQKVNYVRIDGTTRADLRAQLIDKFQTHDACRAAVLSLKACNAGITLTAAQLVLFAELDWNPSTLAQAESRAHRIGQMDNVVVRYLLARKTADDIIWPMLQRKQDILTKAGLCNEDFSDASNVQAPCSAGNIEPYLQKASPVSKGTLDNFVERTAAPQTNNNLSSFLDDDNDDDLAELVL